MTTEIKILLVLCYLFSAGIIYSRTYGLTKLVLKILTWTPALGVIYYFLIGMSPIDNSLTFGLLTGPIVVGLLYELFESICWKLNKRSFHLHAVGAKDMKGLGYPLEKQSHKRIDILFSVILIMMWIGWPMIYVVIIHLAFKN
jgi:hypothetical protein